MRRAAGLALAAALSGCPRLPPPDLERDPAALLRQIREAQARVRSVRGTARVHVDSATLRGTVEEFIAAERPDRLHLETLDFFGDVAAVLVANGGRFAFLDLKRGILYRGEATPENVSKMLPIVLPVGELVTILCGGAPLVDGRPLQAVPSKDGRILLTLGAGEVGQRLTIGEGAAIEASLLRRARDGPGGPVEDNPGYDLFFDHFSLRGGVRFPGAVELDAPAAKVKLSVRWRRDVEVNAALPPALWNLEPPKGVRVVELALGAAIPSVEVPIRPDAAGRGAREEAGK